jgi:hypothetical protein
MQVKLKIFGYIYKITNILNGKCYCGLTTRAVEDRWAQHIQQTRRKSPRGISAAIKAYGHDNFYIEVIDYANCLKDLLDKEQLAIDKHETLAPKGYNLTPGGEFTQSPPLCVNGDFFESRTLASRHFGITSDVLNTRLKRGWTSEQACGLEPPPSDLSIRYKEIKYDNKAELARAFNIPPDIFINRLINGWNIDDALNKPVRKFHIVKIKNKTFYSLRNAAKYLNVPYGAVISRTIRGWTIEQALGLNPSPELKEISIKINDKEYSNLKEAAYAHRINYKKFQCRIRKLGWTPEQAAELVPRPISYPKASAKKIWFRGKQYNSHKELSKLFNISYSVFQGRLNKGRSVEEALDLIKRKIIWARSRSIEINNKYFDTLTDACNYYGLKLPTVAGRLNRYGWSIEQAFEIDVAPKTVREIKIKINKQNFQRASDAARHYGIKPYVLTKRLRKGWSIEEALELKKRPPRKSHNSTPVVVHGKQYQSIKEASLVCKIHYDRVRDRMHRGWTLEEALELKPR